MKMRLRSHYSEVCHTLTHYNNFSFMSMLFNLNVCKWANREQLLFSKGTKIYCQRVINSGILFRMCIGKHKSHCNIKTHLRIYITDKFAKIINYFQIIAIIIYIHSNSNYTFTLWCYIILLYCYVYITHILLLIIRFLLDCCLVYCS